MTDNTELEKKLWTAADKLRNNLDAAEYKHVVLGLIFLKYISDSFDELYQKLEKEKKKTGADPRIKTNTQPSVYFMFLHQPVGSGYKEGLSFLPSAKTLTMRWMPSKRIIKL
jgi:type I restriction-modification system DNA methylase subunit